MLSPVSKTGPEVSTIASLADVPSSERSSHRATTPSEAPRRVRQAAEAAREIIASARNEAIALVREARRELSRELENARRCCAEHLCDRVASISVELDELRCVIIQDSQKAVVSLACRIAREVVAAELVQKPETLLSRVQRALQAQSETTLASVHVHPSHAPSLESHLRALSSTSKLSISVHADSNVSFGDARIEAGGCSVEANTSEHLKALENRLLARFAAAAKDLVAEA